MLARESRSCYYCKANLYDRIAGVTSDTIASGTNCDDLSAATCRETSLPSNRLCER